SIFILLNEYHFPNCQFQWFIQLFQKFRFFFNFMMFYNVVFVKYFLKFPMYYWMQLDGTDTKLICCRELYRIFKNRCKTFKIFLNKHM
ncbi:hypothetical protein L9F63_017062, partial [Diploptera punctata]